MAFSFGPLFNFLGQIAPLAQGFGSAATTFMAYQQEKAADAARRREGMIQARLAEQDAARAALEERRVATAHEKLQKQMFLKSGVMLADSPLLVMEETRQKGIENAQNTLRTGRSRADLYRQQGSITKAALLPTALSAIGDVTSGYTNYLQLQKALK